MTHKLFCSLLISCLCFWVSANDTLNPCIKGQSFHIVVLGSSTAAGTGPSSSDSTWVNRYRKFLQNIDPSNQVTNLAQGGTTTYQIMPSWFVNPSNRPVTNPARNVTQAIALNADAIIVNMPSNDAANNFSVNEQLTNFRTIVSSADSAGIPVWICTTQPRNFGASRIQIQKDVRDSVFVTYGSKALDFWTGIADTAGLIDTTYDSGDGVHLNDAGHRLLFNRVVGKNILSALIDTSGIEDHFVYDLSIKSSRCGSITDSISVMISNRGSSSQYNLVLEWQIRDLNNSVVTSYHDTLYGGVNSCNAYKISRSLNTASGGYWQIATKLLTLNDTVLANDSSSTFLSTSGLPSVQSENDTVCRGADALLWADGGDTTLWYDRFGKLLGFGDSLKVNGIQTGMIYIASLVKGPLYFVESLSAATLSDVNFSGIMFDLVASDTLVLDSLTLKVNTVGSWEVTAYSIGGSYKGSENTSTAWTLWGKDSVYLNQASSWVTINPGSKTLLPGDTLGVYLDMQTGSQLEYYRGSNETVYSDLHLDIITGTGITHSFGTAYYPRIWNGIVHYHRGFNPSGYCRTAASVAVVVRSGNVSLGVDTIIGLGQSLSLGLGNSFTNILWSTGDTSNTVNLDTSLFSGSGPHLIHVQAQDEFGCAVADSMILTFSATIGQEDLSLPIKLEIFPNPSNGRVIMNWNGKANVDAIIFNSEGQNIQDLQLKPGRNVIDIDVPTGLYFVRLPYFNAAPIRLLRF